MHGITIKEAQSPQGLRAPTPHPVCSQPQAARTRLGELGGKGTFWRRSGSSWRLQELGLETTPTIPAQNKASFAGATMEASGPVTSGNWAWWPLLWPQWPGHGTCFLLWYECKTGGHPGYTGRWSVTHLAAAGGGGHARGCWVWVRGRVCLEKGHVFVILTRISSG